MRLSSFFRTDHSGASLALRVALGVVMFPHGAQKLFGWFGGHGFRSTMEAFTGNGLPGILAFLVIMAESIGSLMLIAGLATRLAAFGILAVMVGAIAMVHWPHGFFMNWSGTQAGEGFEYHLLVMAISGTLVAVGAGRLSVDAWLAERLEAWERSHRPPARTVPAHRTA